MPFICLTNNIIKKWILPLYQELEGKIRSCRTSGIHKVVFPDDAS
jgi:hypothetical protein